MSTIIRIVLTAAIMILIAIILLVVLSPKALSIRPTPNEMLDANDPANIYGYAIGAIIRTAYAKRIHPKHLLAISAQESSLGRFTSGDNGCSRGWFHINLCANDAADVIGDPAKEAEWVADRLISYGYLEGNITLSFARYNSPADPNYAYAEQVKKRLGELEIFLEPYRTPSSTRTAL